MEYDAQRLFCATIPAEIRRSSVCAESGCAGWDDAYLPKVLQNDPQEENLCDA